MKNAKTFEKGSPKKRSFPGSPYANYLLILTLSIMMTNCQTHEKSSADSIRTEAAATKQNTYVIEREIPGAGNLTSEDLKSISQKSNGVLSEMGSEVKWLHSYVTGDKIYCVYSSPSEELVREHAKRGGFPANSVSQVAVVIDPSTGN